MPAELIAPALAAGNAVVWTPASVDLGVRGQARRVHRRRGAARRACSRWSPAPAPSSATRSPRARGRTASASSARSRPACTWRRGRPARRRSSSSAATGRWSCSTTPTSPAAAEASIAASFLCAGQSCTAGERFLVHESVHDEFVERLRAAVDALGPARRSARRGDDDGPAEQRADRAEDGRARRRRARARRASSSSAAAARPASRPISTGRRRCSPE